MANTRTDTLADHLAHFLSLVPDAERDARWRAARAALDGYRAAGQAPPSPERICRDCGTARFCLECSFVETEIISSAQRGQDAGHVAAAIDAHRERAAGLDDRLYYPPEWP